MIPIEPEETTTKDHEQVLPLNHIVLNAYPNPFNSSCRIYIDGDSSQQYQLTIYDILGRAVRFVEINDNFRGTKSFLWDGVSQDGKLVPSGVYYVKVCSEKSSGQAKITLMK